MSSISEEANKLADFILFTQRSCILNLSSELNEGKVSYPQFFLLTYLASERFSEHVQHCPENGAFYRGRYRHGG